MYFQEAALELGSDVQTRQARRGRILSHQDEGHQDIVRGTLKLLIKAVDYGEAPIYVVSEGKPSIFTTRVHSIHISSITTHIPTLYLQLLMRAQKYIVRWRGYFYSMR